jgi:predicted transcriptional regulator of viral defense system
MATRPPSIAALFRGTATMRSRDLVAQGLSRSRLSRLVAAGELVRVSRGIYARPGYRITEHGALAIVAQRVPRALFCLLTALRYHELTTQAPFEVWIAIGNKDHAPRIDYPPLRVVRYSSETLAKGVLRRSVDGVPIRVTSIAKTVADCFKFRHQVGLDVALEALRQARQEKRVSADALWRSAKIDRVANVMRPYLEAVE